MSRLFLDSFLDRVVLKLRKLLHRLGRSNCPQSSSFRYTLDCCTRLKFDWGFPNYSLIKKLAADDYLTVVNIVSVDGSHMQALLGRPIIGIASVYN